MRKAWVRIMGIALVALASPALAQSLPAQGASPAQTSGQQVDGDLMPPPGSAPVPDQAPESPDTDAPDGTATRSAAQGGPAQAGSVQGATYHEDDLIGAATGVFGKGAKGVADVIKGILKKQGEPNGYIIGREVSGAFAVGLRYGSGTLYHKVEGQKPVYWTGPSIGFDVGGNGGSTFILVYNLYDTENLYHRFPAGEGAGYFVGGFNVSYLRWSDVVLIPVRAGVGLRLGVNAGYMKFTHKHNWLPF